MSILLFHIGGSNMLMLPYKSLCAAFILVSMSLPAWTRICELN